MAPNIKHEGSRRVAAGIKRKAVDESSSRDSTRIPSKHQREHAEPFREKPGSGGSKNGGKGPLESGISELAREQKGLKGQGKGKGKSAIDDIFADVKRLKQAKVEEEAERVIAKKKAKDEHKRRQENPFTGEGATAKRWAWADEVKPVRFDDDGLPIYTWDSLRIGQGGGTDLCPFDCDCCF